MPGEEIDRPLMDGRDVTMLPEAVRAWRKVRELTQGQLSAATKGRVSESLIALIETGRRQPSYGTAIEIASALDVPLKAIAVVHISDERVAS